MCAAHKNIHTGRPELINLRLTAVFSGIKPVFPTYHSTWFPLLFNSNNHNTTQTVSWRAFCVCVCQSMLVIFVWFPLWRIWETNSCVTHKASLRDSCWWYDTQHQLRNCWDWAADSECISRIYSESFSSSNHEGLRRSDSGSVTVNKRMLVITLNTNRAEKGFSAIYVLKRGEAVSRWTGHDWDKNVATYSTDKEELDI